jgi:dihydroxy-acid dehydratase
MRNQGFAEDVLDGRPVIGIATTWSELTPCNAHLDEVAEAVKRGVWERGGLPLVFPTMSLGEPIMRPTTMLFRNLLAMELEELIRANPLDGVVLLSGCDKTTPGMLMAAASVDLPTIMITGGPMLSGKFKGQDIGSGTDIWRFTEEFRAGTMSAADLSEAEFCMARSKGHCMTMGTASTMAALTEALGVQLPGMSALPAVDSRRYAACQRVGRRIVDMVGEDLKLSQILTKPAFENAVKVNAAIGGSTNAIVHLTALAGRVGVPLDLAEFDSLPAEIPLLVNLKPSGKYLMEDFAYAGGVPVVMKNLLGHLNGDALTVTGKSIRENVEPAECWNDDVIFPVGAPVMPPGNGTVVLYGNLAPSGAVLKLSAASPALLQHTGRALVFDRMEDYVAAADDPSMDVTPDDIIVVRGGGPVGYPGFPEIGNTPLPRKVLEQGITDMVRISDARMSGTGYGTCILHVSPESAVGGPLAYVQTGDIITLDTAARRLDMLISNEELEARAAANPVVRPTAERGWVKLYREHVMQANEGADLDFLVGSSGSEPGRHSH